MYIYIYNFWIYIFIIYIYIKNKLQQSNNKSQILFSSVSAFDPIHHHLGPKSTKAVDAIDVGIGPKGKTRGREEELW